MNVQFGIITVICSYRNGIDGKEKKNNERKYDKQKGKWIIKNNILFFLYYDYRKHLTAAVTISTITSHHITSPSSGKHWAGLGGGGVSSKTICIDLIFFLNRTDLICSPH